MWEVNFFVMQSYKTIVCFVTAWPVVFFLGETIQFAPWGIVSGLFWVPRNAGLAVAGVGTWSSIIVVSSFIFGIVNNMSSDMTHLDSFFDAPHRDLVAPDDPRTRKRLQASFIGRDNIVTIPKFCTHH
jgi:hypothetical protein